MVAGSNIRRPKPATSNRVSAYLLHHLQSLVFSLRKIYETPATTIMTVAVIGITLSLPGGFYLFLKNIDAISGDFRSSSQISLFLDLKTSEKQARALEKKIASVQCYETQFPPQKAHVIERIRAAAMHFGTVAGYDAGELLLTPRTIGTQDVMAFLRLEA